MDASATHPPRRVAAEPPFALLTFASSSAFADASARVVEVGPRLAFQSAWSTNAVGVCGNCGLEKVTRLERSRRFSLTMKDGGSPSDEIKLAFASIVHDRMTECVYDTPLASFDSEASAAPVCVLPVLAEGCAALPTPPRPRSRM